MAARECNLENICQRYCNWVRWTRIRRQRPPPNPINGRRRFYQSRLYALRGKNLLACLICYTFYSGVDWEGIQPVC